MSIPEMNPKDVFAKRNEFTIIDVRQPEEFVGELGDIEGAELMPLATIEDKLEDYPKDKPYIFVCRSGGRSGKATAYALSVGFKNVFNMTGGMILWNGLNLKTEGKNS